MGIENSVCMGGERYEHAQDMNAAMSALETYMNAEDPLDPLIRTALIHYFVFKTCHNHIYVNDGFQKQPAFFELLRVIYCCESLFIRVVPVLTVRSCRTHRFSYLLDGAPIR